MSNITSVAKWGNSLGVRIPKNILDLLEIGENDRVSISTENGFIKISKKEPSNIKELFSDFEENCKQKEIDLREPVGDEIW